MQCLDNGLETASHPINNLPRDAFQIQPAARHMDHFLRSRPARPVGVLQNQNPISISTALPGLRVLALIDWRWSPQQINGPSSAYSQTTPHGPFPKKQCTPRSTSSLGANCNSSSLLVFSEGTAPLCRVRGA